MHALLFFERPLDAAEVADLESWMFGRWLNVAMRKGLGTVTRERGVDVRPITTLDGIADYLTTLESGWTPGLELTRSDIKRRNPFDLLRAVLDTGDSATVALWLEYELATFGKRAIVWSPGLRKRLLGVETEESDEAVASSEGLDLALLRALVPTGRWNATLRDATTGALLTDIERCAAALFFITDTLGHEIDPRDVPRHERSPSG
jgi:hypothetical protein